MRSSLPAVIVAAFLAACTPAPPPHSSPSSPSLSRSLSPAPAPAPTPAPTEVVGAPVDLVALEKEATSAYQRKDVARFLALSEGLLAAAPGEPRRIYNLACGQALTGQRALAFHTLQSLANGGVYFDLAADTDLDGLAGSPEFTALRARFEALRTAVVTRSKIAFQLAERDLIPEGLTHDPSDGAFFVSSVHKRKIVRVDAAFTARDFTAVAQDGLGAVLALLTGPGRGHVCNDPAVDASGTVLVSDAQSGAVYTANPGDTTLTELLAPGILKSPQGIAVSPDGKTLYIADHARGIARVDRASHRVTMLPGPAGVFLTGIDALVLHRGALIATQNGLTPHRLVRARIDPAGERIVAMETLEMNHPSYREPTLGTLVGSHFFYVANSQWESFDKDGVLAPIDRLQAPVILDAPLE